MSFFIPEIALFQNQRHKISPPDNFFNFRWGLFLLKMDYQGISRLEYFEILTKANIQTLEWFNILVNYIK